MHYRIIFYVESFVVAAISFFHIFPIYISLSYQTDDLVALLISFFFSLFIFLLLYFFSSLIYINQSNNIINLSLKDSFLLVVVAWLISAFLYSVPYIIYYNVFNIKIEYINYPFNSFKDVGFKSFTDIYFEMISGFTTTGSSVLNDIESMPYGLLYLRSMTQWMGGIGIILLILALSPSLYLGDMNLYIAEVPGLTYKKIVPKLVDTVRIVFFLYISFTVMIIFCYFLGGMELFDAICHSYATVSTGGFSTKNLSIGYYKSYGVYLTTIIFMFLSSISFSLHYRSLKKGPLVYLKNTEFKVYFCLLIAYTIVLSLNVYFSGIINNIFTSFYYVLFQVISVISTTGYSYGIEAKSIYHFGMWTTFSKILFIYMMISGSCVGSTSGGMKILRLTLFFKILRNEVHKLVNPRHVIPLKLDSDILDSKLLISTSIFIILYLFIFFVSSLLISFFEPLLTLEEIISISFTSLGNIGPALGNYGPDSNFNNLTVYTKWISIFCMLLGRLEIYSVLVLFFFTTWKSR